MHLLRKFEDSFPCDYLETELDATCEYFATCTNVHTHTHEDAHKDITQPLHFFAKSRKKSFVVVVVLLLNVHGKRLRSCRDSQLT